MHHRLELVRADGGHTGSLVVRERAVRAGRAASVRPAAGSVIASASFRIVAAADRAAGVVRGSDLVLAAVDVQVGAEDEAALLGGEERHDRGDFLRASNSALRRPVMNTYAPSAASRTAAARPIPVPPPGRGRFRHRTAGPGQGGQFRRYLDAQLCQMIPGRPVRGGAVAVEQSGCRKDERAVADRDDVRGRRTTVGQEGDGGLVEHRLLHEPARYEQDVEPFRTVVEDGGWSDGQSAVIREDGVECVRHEVDLHAHGRKCGVRTNKVKCGGVSVEEGCRLPAAAYRPPGGRASSPCDPPSTGTSEIQTLAMFQL